MGTPGARLSEGPVPAVSDAVAMVVAPKEAMSPRRSLELQLGSQGIRITIKVGQGGVNFFSCNSLSICHHQPAALQCCGAAHA